MRERLFDLIAAEIPDDIPVDRLPDVDAIVERLLAAGVIVPPCKVGDTVYYLTSVDTEKELNVADIFCGTVQSVAFDGKNIWVAAKYTNGLYYHHKEQDFGRDVFLAKEEAEKALKGGAENG